ncbi:MAG: hypothetical protein ACHQVK_01625 [Candidatus Paceibacterales bacterium]
MQTFYFAQSKSSKIIQSQVGLHPKETNEALPVKKFIMSGIFRIIWRLLYRKE